MRENLSYTDQESIPVIAQVFHGHCPRQVYDCIPDWTFERKALPLHIGFRVPHTNHRFVYDRTPVKEDEWIENNHIGPLRYSLHRIQLMYIDTPLNHSHCVFGKSPVIAGTMEFSL